MTLAEPMTLLTDYALTGVTGWLGVRLWRARQGQAARAWWTLAFAALAAAAAMGGTHHGFAPQLAAPVLHGLWTATVLAVGFGSGAMLAGTTLATTAGRLRTLMLSLAGAKFAVYAAWMLGHSAFVYVIVDSALAMAAIAALHAGPALRRENAASAWMLAAIAVSALAAAVQASGFALHRHFNHNDLYHVIQIAAMLLFFRAARELRDRQTAGAPQPVLPGRDNGRP